MTAQLSKFARSLSVETAFTVLAVAKSLKTAGKDVVELEIGDSPFDSTASAKAAGVQAIEHNQSHYCPSPGIPEFREAAARFVKREFNIPAEAKNIIAGPGAKVFEQFFCEAFLDPGDGVLVFGPYFPTYLPNIERRGARAVVRPLLQSNQFRPDVAEVERFLAEDKAPKAIFLNSPHNPTGGVATEDDLQRIAAAVRGKNLAVFSDEPYCHMVWKGKHASILAQPGMLDQSVAAFTFSKSYSMSGWRLGFAVAGRADRGSHRQNDQHDALLHAGFGPACGGGGPRSRPGRTRRRDAQIPRQGRTADDGSQPDRGISHTRSRRQPFTSFRMWLRSAIAWGSPATGWRSTCWRGPTTNSASLAWEANASATRAAASFDSASPSRTIGCNRRSTFCRSPCREPIELGRTSKSTPGIGSNRRTLSDG